MTAAPPLGPYTKAQKPDVCIGESKACGLCANCTMPQADPRVWATIEKIDQLSLRDTLAYLDDLYGYEYTAGHRLCTDNVCFHGGAWYRNPHCHVCIAEPWPCTYAVMTSVHRYLTQYGTVTS